MFWYLKDNEKKGEIYTPLSIQIFEPWKNKFEKNWKERNQSAFHTNWNMW